MATFLRVYDNGLSPRGIMSHHSQLSVQTVFNDMGSLTFNYPKSAPVANLLDLPDAYLAIVEDAREIPEWFILEDDGEDAADEAGAGRLVNASARGCLSLLERARIYPKAHTPGANPNGMKPEHPFSQANPGTILGELMRRAQARGALAGITFPSFNGVRDSAGKAWPTKYDVTYAAGLDYYATVQAMVDNGWIDVRMDRLELKVFVPDSASVDRPDVILRLGQNVLEGPRKRSRRGVATTMLAVGSETNAVEQINTSALATRGRREGYVGDGRMTSSGSLGVLARSALEKAKQAAEGITVSVAMDLDRNTSGGYQWHRPGVDFQVGDWIRYDQRRVSDTELERLRVRTFTWGWSNRDAPRTCNIELNDLFVEQSVRTARRVNGLLNGSPGGSTPPLSNFGSVPDPAGADSTTPGPPTGVNLLTEVYPEQDRFRVVVAVQWTAPTLNTDGTDYVDPGGYETSYRLGYSDGLGPWIGQAKADFSPAIIDNLPPGKTFQARVRAVDRTGNTSTWAQSGEVFLATDTTPPPPPSKPLLEDNLGSLRVGWDGLDKDGGPMPFDLDYVEVHVSQQGAFKPTAATRVETFLGKSTTTVESFGFGVAAYARLVAVDRSRNRSDPSAIAGPVRPQKIGASSINDEVGGYVNLAYKDSGNLVDDGSFETDRSRGYITGQGAAGAKWAPIGPGSSAAFGSWFMQGSFGASAATPVFLTEPIGYTANGTEKWWVRCSARFSSGVPSGTGLSFAAYCYDRNNRGLTSPQQQVNVSRDGSWRVFGGYLSGIPAGTAFIRFAMVLAGGIASGQTVDVDTVEIRAVVATEIIDDAAITRAKIDDLAVDDAKIANLNVGKLRTGLLYADVTVSGSIRTSSSGPRVELNSSGLSLYSSTGRTGYWNAANGNIDMTGTFRTDANNGRSVVIAASLSSAVGAGINQAGMVFANTAFALRYGQLYDNGAAIRIDSPAFDNSFRQGSTLDVSDTGIRGYTSGTTVGAYPAASAAPFQVLNNGDWRLGRDQYGYGFAEGNSNRWTISTRNGGTEVTGDSSGTYRFGTANGGGTSLTGNTSSWRLGTANISGYLTASNNGYWYLGDSLFGDAVSISGGRGSWRFGVSGGIGVYCNNNTFWRLGTSNSSGYASGDTYGNTTIGNTGSGGSRLIMSNGSFDFGISGGIGLSTAGNSLNLQGGNGYNGITMYLRSGTWARVQGGNGLYVAGSLGADRKQFIIDHPTKPNRVLVHGTTESPHFGVHYWGRATTGDDGQAVVTLPGYFEALTIPGQRAILLTPVGVPVAVGASAIDAGTFTIYAPPGTDVSWLVQAVRADATFDVEPLRTAAAAAIPDRAPDGRAPTPPVSMPGNNGGSTTPAEPPAT